MRGNVTVVDADTLATLQTVAAEGAGIPQRLAGRLRGETIGELRVDAKALAKELGLAPEQGRDEHGRFASMDELMRAGSRR
jgi:hypothetical protein